MTAPNLGIARRILGVPLGASRDAICRATRRLARRYHPDLGGDVEHFKRVLRARDALLAEFDD